MKRILTLITLFLAICSLAFAETVLTTDTAGVASSGTNSVITSKLSTLSLQLKQGVVFKLKDGDSSAKNLTAVTIAKTTPVNGWGKWNALYSGWTIDAGVAYDANTADTLAVLLGREFETLGDYLPVAFPLKDKLSITIYPIGIYLEDLYDTPRASMCAGGALITVKMEI